MPGRAPSYRLRHVLAERFGLEPDQILVGNGSCELLGCVTKAFGGPGDNLVTADKTFAVYEWVGGSPVGRSLLLHHVRQDWERTL